MVHGQFVGPTASRFAVNLGGPFTARTAGLTAAEIAQIMNEASQL
jgi:hypothetical protein